MADVTKTLNLGAGAGKTIDLGAVYGYIEVHTVGGEMQYQLSLTDSSDPGAALVAGAPSVSDCVRLAAGTGKTHGLNRGGGYDGRQNDTQARYVRVWAIAAGTLTVVAR